MSEPIGVTFSFYSGDQAKQLSVKQVTSSSTFDNVNTPIVGGLYDPALGPTEPSHGNCPTCGPL